MYQCCYKMWTTSIQRLMSFVGTWMWWSINCPEKEEISAKSGFSVAYSVTHELFCVHHLSTTWLFLHWREYIKLCNKISIYMSFSLCLWSESAISYLRLSKNQSKFIILSKFAFATCTSTVWIWHSFPLYFK